jgi:hypothetical protein
MQIVATLKITIVQISLSRDNGWVTAAIEIDIDHS